MNATEDIGPAQRMRLAFDLFEMAEKLMRQNLERSHPEASDAEIEERLVAWLRHHPGAEMGDASGPDFRISDRFR
jgi:hypothetical protein